MVLDPFGILVAVQSREPAREAVIILVIILYKLECPHISKGRNS